MAIWQVQLIDDRIINYNEEKLPLKCKWIRLIDSKIVKISIEGPGEPFFFIRHFCSLDGPERLEYHIGIKQEGKTIEYSYDPARGVGCFGEMIV